MGSRLYRKSGNNGNQCVSVKKRLKIQYFRDFTEQKQEEIIKGAKEADIYFTKVTALFAPNKNDRKKAYKKLEREYGICI